MCICMSSFRMKSCCQGWSSLGANPGSFAYFLIFFYSPGSWKVHLECLSKCGARATCAVLIRVSLFWHKTKLPLLLYFKTCLHKQGKFVLSCVVRHHVTKVRINANCCMVLCDTAQHKINVFVNGPSHKAYLREQ
jgi:hypothetical protein